MRHEGGPGDGGRGPGDRRQEQQASGPLRLQGVQHNRVFGDVDGNVSFQLTPLFE